MYIKQDVKLHFEIYFSPQDFEKVTKIFRNECLPSPEFFTRCCNGIWYREGRFKENCSFI